MSNFITQEILEKNTETSSMEISNMETSNMETFSMETSVKKYNILSSNATDIGGGKENQDGYLYFRIFLKSGDEATIECVFDGHGINGKLIVDLVVNETRNYIYEYIDIIESDHVLFFNNLISILDNKTQTKYRYQGGTTATINILLKGKIYNCNCGDSDSKLFLNLKI